MVEKEKVNLATERFRFLIQVRKILGFERFQKLKTVYDISRRQKIRRIMDVVYNCYRPAFFLLSL